jgi:hypothetical protein
VSRDAGTAVAEVRVRNARGEVGSDLTASGEETEPDTEPAMSDWLIQVLGTVIGMPPVEVDRLTGPVTRQPGAVCVCNVSPLGHQLMHTS